MKKFFPVAAIVIIFMSMLVSQMLINGQELSASLFEKNKERYSLYENQFMKMSAKTTKGHIVKLKDIKEPIVIVNFWASWCRPCISEFKSINSLLKKHGDKIFVIGINNDTESAGKAILKTEKEYNLQFSSVKDVEGKYADLFNVTKIPSTIVFYKGKVLTFSDAEFDFMSEQFLGLIESKF